MRLSRSLLTLFAATVLAPFTWSCAKTKTSKALEAPGEPTVARVDGTPISARDLRVGLGLEPKGSPGRYSSLEAKKELLSAAVRFEVMVKEAERRGLDKDPEVILATKHAMIDKLLKQERITHYHPDRLTDAEIQRYYDEHQRDFNRPEQIRLRHILVKDRRTAERVAAQAKALPPRDLKAFAELVEEHSEDEATKEGAGDMGGVDRHSNLPKPLLDAAFALPEGGVAGPFATPAGFEIIKSDGKASGVYYPLAAIRNEIRGRLASLAMASEMQSWLDKVPQGHDVRLYEDDLRKIDLDKP